MNTEEVVLRCVAGCLAGVGAIILALKGVISPEATTAILAALLGFFIGEHNGRRTAGKS